MSDPHVSGEVVVVTGASSGIGRETALRYAGRHACLALAARSEDALLRVAGECRSAGAMDVVVHVTDISDAAQVAELFEVATARFGRIDIAVQCARPSRPSGASRTFRRRSSTGSSRPTSSARPTSHGRRSITSTPAAEVIWC